MIVLIDLFIATATVAVAGGGVASLLSQRRLSWWEYCALAWLFGTSLVSLSLWIGGLFLHGIALQSTVTGICVLIGIIGFRRLRANGPKQQAASGTRFEFVLVTLFVVGLTAMFWASFQHDLGWDGLLVWEIKARYAFLNRGVIPPAFFSDVSRHFANPHYPLLLPLTETWFYLWLGDTNQFWIKVIFPIWCGAAMSILLIAGEELSGEAIVGWLVALLFPLIPCLHNKPGGFQVGYADAPLGAMYLAAGFYLLRFIRDGSRDAMVLFITLAALLPWMKPEGIVLWSTISLCGAVALRIKERPWAIVAASFLPGLTLIVVWQVFLTCVHESAPKDFAFPTLAMLGRNIHHVGGILDFIIRELTSLRNWGFFWLFVGLAMCGIVVRWRRLRPTALMWLFLVPFVCYCASYLVSALPDYVWHMRTSLRRHFIQLAPTAWLLIALALAPRKPTEEQN
jgi:hypothetical protein